jgi:hypothetical protein
MFTPGNRALVSEQQAELVEEVSSLLTRMTHITPEERAIVKMTVDLLDHLYEYATGPTNEEWETMSKDERDVFLTSRKPQPGTFTVDEFQNVLICSGALELHDGHVAPRF